MLIIFKILYLFFCFVILIFHFSLFLTRFRMFLFARLNKQRWHLFAFRSFSSTGIHRHSSCFGENILFKKNFTAKLTLSWNILRRLQFFNIFFFNKENQVHQIFIFMKCSKFWKFCTTFFSFMILIFHFSLCLTCFRMFLFAKSKFTYEMFTNNRNT